jgi:hypothetical protein
MMRRNWDHARERKLMRRHGIESVQGDASFMRPLLRRKGPPRPRQRSKAELRAEAAAAQFEGVIKRR